MHIRPDKRGTRNHNSKLDLNKVQYILGSSKSNVELAHELGVSPAAVSNVRTGRTWSWIDREIDEDNGLEFPIDSCYRPVDAEAHSVVRQSFDPGLIGRWRVSWDRRTSSG